jgi:16S rRNA C967 or C1407 C5-methylase (RsmB/RsmF family)/NOL1/NOP2/fmu family ribosome biogenesis protein
MPVPSLPPLFLDRIETILGKDEFLLFKESYQKPTITSLRLNPLKPIPNHPDLNDRVPWCSQGRYVDPLKWNGHHPYHHAGAFYFQEASAMAVVELMDIQPDDIVLDLAAAPGGKATQIGAKLGVKGLLIANDIDAKRAQTLMFNVERLGLTQVVVTQHNPDHLSNMLPAMFDKILVDAPCSGEGMFRHDIDAVVAWSLEHVQVCAYRQKQLLNSAVKLLKPGGQLFYSTCTFASEENELLIQNWLNDHPEFKLLKHPMFDWFDQKTTQGIGVKLWPHRLRGDGHYVALLQHQGQPSATIPFQHRMKNPPEKLWQSFSKSYLINSAIEPNFILEDRLFMIPGKFAYHSALHMLRAGVYLGDIQKHVFYPSHHLAHILKPEQVKMTLQLTLNSPDLKAYLAGQELPTTLEDGWVLVGVDGLSLGWGKVSQGRMKNHYPKGLRSHQFTI